MAKAFQKSFTGGELSPSLHARTDLTKYANGLKQARNLFIGRQGGAYNRPGSIFGCVAKDPTKRVRLISFDLPNNVRYQLEFGHLYMRPLMNWKPITIIEKNIVAITKGTTTVVKTLQYHGFQVGDSIKFSDIVGMTNLNGVTSTVTAIDPDGVTFTVAQNSSAYSNYTSGGYANFMSARPVQIATTFTESEIFEMTHQQVPGGIILAHVNHLPVTISHASSQWWTIANTSTDPAVTTPVMAALPNPGTAIYYTVSAILDNGEESLAATPVGTNTGPTPTAGLTVTWSAIPTAVQYNVYRGRPGAFGLIQVVTTNSFFDNAALNEDFKDYPYRVRPMFSNSAQGPRPHVVGYYQQRQMFGNLGPPLPEYPAAVLPISPPDADRVLMSRIGSPTFFNIDHPVQDDSSISFRLISRRAHAIRHFLDIGKLLVLTDAGEWIIRGAADGAVTPSAINPELISSYGTGFVPPLPIDTFAIYIQRGRSAIIRSLGFEFQVDNYKGDDLTINANHLVDGFNITSWDFQSGPNPIVWSARNDGMLLGVTMVQSQGILAWHRHDFTNGFVECVLRSGDEVGFVIRRTILGVTTRYIEYFSDRNFADIKDAIFMDSALTYDGRNKNPSHYMQLTGGTTWDTDDVINIFCSAGKFTVADVGQAIHLTGVYGQFQRFKILSYVDANNVQVKPLQMVPADVYLSNTSNWAMAKNFVSGLSHLNGQKVSILGDGFVVASPNNPAYVQRTVASGSVSFVNDDLFYSVLQVGLPITADLETLNIDNPGGESMVDKKKLISKVTLWLENTRGVYVGTSLPDDNDDPTQGLNAITFNELKYRESEGYFEPSRMISRPIEINISGNYNNNGRVLVRQIDPLPMGILAISPDGYLPTGGR